jgi:hypothetical protein
LRIHSAFEFIYELYLHLPHEHFNHFNNNHKYNFDFNIKFNNVHNCDNNLNVLQLHEYDLDDNHYHIILDNLYLHSNQPRHKHHHYSNDHDNRLNLH